MDINFGQIAAAVVSTLAPFTPYLVESGKKFAGKAGEAAWTKAEQIWHTIMSHFGDDTKIKGAALMVSADPKDETSQTMLAKALAARLQEKPDLAQDLFKLLGGQEAVQQVLSDRSSWVEDVMQQTTGGGSQTVKASEDSVIKGVRQIKQ